MQKFLEKLAGELHSQHAEDISKICVVFPSRRAGLYFKQYLGRLNEKPIWSPAVYSVEDFIETISPLRVIDRLTLIFELYEIYKTYGTDESFDKFYPWGEVLLGDFDDIDKNMAESDKLFRILYEHKKVEDEFDFKLSDIDEFDKFWRSFSGKGLSTVQDNFIKTWEIMGKVYHSFRSALIKKNTCYEGMAYRRVCEMTRSKALLKTIQTEYGWMKIVFAGFNMLTLSEHGIISGLVKQGIAETYWDTDEYYLNNNIQEAGSFLRKNFRDHEITDVRWRENNLLETKKNIRIIGAPLKVAQAKVLGNELKHVNDLSDTAVILPDDSILLPVLHSIPENIKKLNITMGLPFKDSPLYSLLYVLKSIHSTGRNNSSSFYHKDITQMLLHPYIKFSAPNEIFELVSYIRKRNIVYTSRKRILEAFTEVPEIISAIFNKTETAKESLEHIYRIIELISKNLESSGSQNSFDAEYLFKFYTELNKLDNILTTYSAEMTSDTFWKLLVEIARSIKIPFTGEPLQGLQIMGLLESRALDFKNVYILSMNEGTMPSENAGTSFIPHNLRKGLKMPVFEDRDSDAAYYFYRLLQRAENITLIYNTEPGELSGGEKSRFIMQVENELAAANKNITIEEKILQTDVELPIRKSITIEKSDEILQKLREREYFSATTIGSYINCPLQFYFRTVTRLRKQEEVEEFFSGGGFGSILHKIMEMLYRPYVGTIVDEKLLRAMKKNVKTDYEKIWEDACMQIPEYEEFRSGLKGKNLLYKNIIKKLVEKIISIDIQHAPFKVLDVEKRIEKDITISPDGSEHTVKILGVLDRVQLKNNVEQIIDYKTGKLDIKRLARITNAENLGDLFTKPSNKEKFQQHFYSSIYLNGKAGKLKLGIYPLQDLSEGIVFFNQDYIPQEVISLYEESLIELLNKIFDSTTPFPQTPEIDHCRFCDFKSICYRD